MSRIFAPLVSLLLLSACATSGPTFAENGYPVLSEREVTVYESVDEIPDTFEVIGSVQYYYERRMTSRRVVVSAEEVNRMRARSPSDISARRVEEARRDAAEMGANGVLIVTAENVGADPRIRRAVEGRPWYSDRQYVAIYVGPPPVTATGSD